MSVTTLRELFDALLETTLTGHVRAILMGIGDSADSALDQPFGPLGLQWHAFGDSTSNLSSIGLASKAGRSVTERITNMFDALLEDRKPSGIVPPDSPRLAAQQWFGRPMTGPGEGLFTWKYSTTGIDRRAHVVISSSGNDNAPTIDVIDDGTGIVADRMPTTILSLHEGDKMSKRYLMGAFGQGGASTLAFCDYCLVVCRGKEDPATVGFTLIKVLTLAESYKEDCWAYLALNDNGRIVVPTVSIPAEPIDVYPIVAKAKLPVFNKGVLVRHYSYQLSGLTGRLGPAPGNLYHYLHVSMFDSLFPFRVIDRREEDEPRDELITGTRNRLMRLTSKKPGEAIGDEEAGGGSRSELKHHRPMEYVTPPGSTEPSIGIEYWVVFNFKKGKTDKKEDRTLRSHSNELYVHRGHPIVGVLNGQNQGELTARLLAAVGLPMVARHVVINIDASNASSIIRRQLFSTNREGFKEGPVLDEILRLLKKMLEEDDELAKLEEEIADRLAKSAADTTSDEVKRQVTQLLLDAGIHVRAEGPSFVPGGSETVTGKRPRTGTKPTKPDPLPTLPFPEVTRFELVWPKPRLTVHIGDNEVVLIETDADTEFDRQGRLAIRSEPSQLEVAGKSPLRGGRIRWRLRPTASAVPGATGKIIVTLTKSDGQQLVDETGYEVLAPYEVKGKKAPDLVPPFEIVPISPVANPQEWETVWPELQELEQNQVAYKIVNASGKTIVYYSTIFEPFFTQAQKLSAQSATLGDAFRTNYSVWIGYHAILQDRDRKLADTAGLEDETFEKLLEMERATVGKMQVKQAAKTAELMLRTQQVASAEV
jgi:hypothetical protein